MTTPEQLEPEDKAAAREIFEGRVEGRTACWHCGGIHAVVANLQPYQQPCPRIKRVERDPDGKPVVTEYWEPGTWESGIVFPDHVWDEENE